MNFNQAEIAFALETARRASQLIRTIQLQMVTQALTKDDHSPVTVADFASQALISYRLLQAFPQDALVAEEGADALRAPEANPTLGEVTKFVGEFIPQATDELICAWIDHGASQPSKRYWCLDPIDGTKGFLRGDQYVVALALIEDNRVQLGVLGCPNLTLPGLGGQVGCIVFAARGQGAWAAALNVEGNYVPLRASSLREPAKARLLCSFESGHTNVDQTDALMRRLGIEAEAVRMDSQAKYALLAAGGGELMLRMLSLKQPDYREKIWDHAAGSLILEEAGGKITDLRGDGLDFTTGRSLYNNRGIFASNGVLHPPVLEALREIGV